MSLKLLIFRASNHSPLQVPEELRAKINHLPPLKPNVNISP
jgi:hypothetical protein